MRFPFRTTAAALGLPALAVLGAATGARALPPPAPPQSAASASPTPASGAILPYGSPLLFVLDEGISSAGTPPGTTVHMHLKAPLVVNGRTLVPAGAPASFLVVSTRKAHSGDEDGAIEIHLDPLAIPGRQEPLPMRAIHEYLTRELTGGQVATRGTIDTVEDVFIPYAVLYQVFRKGHQMVLPPGSILRAKTDASIDASDPRTIVLSTPAPFRSNYDPPHADLTPAPFYTPAPQRPKPLPKGKPTLPPSAAPTTSASPATAASAAAASPSASATNASPTPSATRT